MYLRLYKLSSSWTANSGFMKLSVKCKITPWKDFVNVLYMQTPQGNETIPVLTLTCNGWIGNFRYQTVGRANYIHSVSSSLFYIIHLFIDYFDQKTWGQRSSSLIFIIIVVISLKNEDNMQYGNVTGKLYKYIECCWLCDKRLNFDVISTVHEGIMKTYSSWE